MSIFTLLFILACGFGIMIHTVKFIAGLVCDTIYTVTHFKKELHSWTANVQTVISIFTGFKRSEWIKEKKAESSD